MAVAGVLADPAGAAIALITRADPGLGTEAAERAVTGAARGRTVRRRLALALAERPRILSDGRSPAPRAAGDLLLALRKAGSTVISPPACASCGRHLRTLSRRGQDWYCGAYAADVSRRTRGHSRPPNRKAQTAMSSPVPGFAPGKYARIERERRFLLDGLPAGQHPAQARTIVDHYLAGTTLRLRCVRQPGGDQYKLTQKIPAPQPGPVQGLITNIYLSEAEYNQLAAALPGRRLAKTRYSIPPLGIDVFNPPLHGLVTAEAEFGTDEEMLAFQPPGYVHAEITDDPRFTGGSLAVAPREDLISWLTQYGISPDDPDLKQRG